MDSRIRSSRTNLLGVLFLIVTVAAPVALFLTVVSAAPVARPPAGWQCHEDGTCTRVATPVDESDESGGQVPVIEYTFSEEEALVIEGYLPPAYAEVSFTEAEVEPIVVARPSRTSALARR